MLNCFFVDAVSEQYLKMTTRCHCRDGCRHVLKPRHICFDCYSVSRSLALPTTSLGDPCPGPTFTTPGIGYSSGFQSSLRSSLPSALHILYVSLYQSATPTSVLAVSTNELMSWIRCDRWGSHIKCAGMGVLQDRFENHWVIGLHYNHWVEVCYPTRTRGSRNTFGFRVGFRVNV